MTDIQIHVQSSGRKFTAKPGQSLMEALIGQNIFLRADCGGKGTCGKCAVRFQKPDGQWARGRACQMTVQEPVVVDIPPASMLSPHIISKAPVVLPDFFRKKFQEDAPKGALGVAVDLGTTTIAIYLCRIGAGRVISSLAVKNPQVLYGDDVMSRISSVASNPENLSSLQAAVVRALEWGIRALVRPLQISPEEICDLVVAGNPTMIHILAGVDPQPIGVSPFRPVFKEPRSIPFGQLGLNLGEGQVQLLNQVSGFIGSDILSATLAADLDHLPDRTLLMDLGTNGELMLKANGRFYAASCATGPAFEGASISCGMQAIPGAVDRVRIDRGQGISEFTTVKGADNTEAKPSGVCGTGIISAVAQFFLNGIVAPSGAFTPAEDLPALQQDEGGKQIYVIADTAQTGTDTPVFISQKDIRSVQLGKAAVRTGVDLLMKTAGIDTLEQIIVAGAFGSYIGKQDLITLGMIPVTDVSRVVTAGNAAGAGAVMVLCDEDCTGQVGRLAAGTQVIELASDPEFQDRFVENLSFPAEFINPE